jgi:glutathione S-transferase
MMLKLFFSPGACCMSCHITLEMTHTPFELVYVGKNADEKTRAEFLKVNPLGAVPAVLFDDHKVLTQNIAILEYIADQKPEAKLIAPTGTWERAEIMKWLSFVAADLHKSFSPLFRLSSISANPEAQSDIKKWAFANIEKYLSLLEKHLSDKTYLVGEHFTIADAYLFTVYQWSKPVGFPVEKFTALNAYSDRIAALPAVKKVHEREEAFR